MQLDQSAQRRRRAISLTPLIDVVFILLLFFMLSSNFMHWRQVNLSTATHAQPEQLDPKEIRIVRILDDQGALNFDGVELLLNNEAGLREQIASDPDAVYAIEVEEGIMTQTMITLLDTLKQLGATHVSLAGVLP